MKKRIYFAYGSNQCLHQMAHRCPTAKVIGTANLMGYELLFRGNGSGAVATVEKKPHSFVPLVVWEIYPKDELALDIYEGAPRFYRKETVKARQGNKWLEGMIYIMNPGRPLGEPSKGYYNTILDGYKSAGFDTSILEKAVEVSVNRAERSCK